VTTLAPLALLVLAWAAGDRDNRSDTISLAAAPLDEELQRVPQASAFWLPDPVYAGGRIYVVRAGAVVADQPTLVLVHGLGTAGVRDFYPILAALAQSRRVVAFDLPGFGRSTQANQPYTPQRYATVLAHLIQRVSLGPVDVLGHSMGGAIALEHAGTHGAQVRRLIVVDAAGILHREAFVSHMVRGGTEPTVGRLPWLSDLVRDTTGALFEQTHKLDPAPDVIIGNKMLRKLFLRGDPVRIAGLALILHNVGPALGAITAPTLIVWGRDDAVAPPRTGAALAARIAGADLVTLDGVGHDPMADAPTRLRELIEGHLQPAAGPGRSGDGAGVVAKSQGDYHCRGRADLRLSGVYDDVVLEGCDRAQLEGVVARQLVLRQSKAAVMRSSFTGGVVAQASQMVMTGGQVGGTIALDLESSRVDLAGVSLRATQRFERLSGLSRLVYSVCALRTIGGIRHAHGIESSQPAPIK
jgi:pimeloyl-ACP methyl ester carboxylesterase